MKAKQTFIKIAFASAVIMVIPNWSLATNVYDDVIVPSLNHTILEEAIVQANLETALRTSPNLTVFAPTDDAFMNAGFNSIQDIVKTPVEALTPILLYHVVVK